MTELLITVLLLVAIWLLLSYLIKLKKWKNQPPGPSGIPLLGSLHLLTRGPKEPLQVIQEWSHRYGDVCSFHLGHYRVVLLSNYETIKEAYSKWDFSGRYLLKPFHLIAGGEKRGLTFSEGAEWAEQRRFALRTLRDFGFGKKSMQEFIHEDITELLESFKALKGAPFVPQRKFGMAVLKSLWNILAGERFALGDPKFQTVLDGLSIIVSATSVTGPVFFLPWLTTLFPRRTGWSELESSISNAKNMLSGYITEHQRTFQSDNIRDYIDAYLNEIRKTEDPSSSFFQENGEKHLRVALVNLFAAGAETTNSALSWALLYLVKYPHVQERLYQEIVTVIGTSRLPSLEEKEDCVYAWAVMEEVSRISSTSPLGIFHSTMNDTTFHGYHIPKDTLIMANIYGVHHSKKIWGDPEIFRPERFLMETGNGKLAKNLNAGPCIPFSVGKRACPGETLARNNFFLYLTSLVQKFKISAYHDPDTLKEEAMPGFLRAPKDFEIVIKER